MKQVDFIVTPGENVDFEVQLLTEGVRINNHFIKVYDGKEYLKISFNVSGDGVETSVATSFPLELGYYTYDVEDGRIERTG